MSTAIVLIIVAIVAVLLVSRRSGPRVTHIETRREDDTKGE